MKSRFLLLAAFVSLIALYVAACGTLYPSPTPLQQTQQARQLADALNAAREAAVAATQPIVVVPATETQPAVTVAPPKELVKAGNAAAPYIAAGQAGVQVVAAGDPPESGLGATLLALAPLAGAAGGYLGAAGILLKLIGAIKKQKATDAAVAKNAEALNNGIATGKIIVNPGAGAIANGIVDAHPLGNQLIDTLTNAAKDAHIPD